MVSPFGFPLRKPPLIRFSLVSLGIIWTGVLFTQLSALATAQGTIESNLQSIEARIFHKYYGSDSAETRIKRLEIMLFPGQKMDSSMTLENRLEKILFRVAKDQDSKKEEAQEKQESELQVDSSDTVQRSKSKPSSWDETLDDVNLRKIDADVILIMLDCSHSMIESLSGKTIGSNAKTKLSTSARKMDIAKDAIVQIVQRVPSNCYLGLRTYGMGYTGDPFMDCKQSKLVVPPAKSNRQELFSSLRELQPYGLTPLEYSLRQMVENDIVRFTGKKTIFLISDGADTCGGNPCEFVKQMPRLGIKAKIHCLSLALKHKPDDILARQQISCISEVTQGKYLEVTSVRETMPWLDGILQETLENTSQEPSSL